MPTMRSSLNQHRILSALMMFALLATGTKTTPLFAAKPDKKNSPIPVIVAPVRLGELADRVEALGTARANESVTLTANVAEKVRAIRFEDGQQVQRGEVLVELEQKEEQANLVQARALLRDKQLALKRNLRLQKGNLTAQEVIDRARFEVEQAKANINAIQARIDDRIIRAPFTGIVGLRHISVGSLVEAGDAVVTLDDISSIKLDFSVPEIFLPNLKTALPIQARAAALGNQVYHGEVKSIDSRIDPVTRSVQVRAVLPNTDGRMVPGMLMQVDLLHNPRQTLMIPESALLPQAEKQFVMVRVQKDGLDQVEKRPITIGTRQAGQVEIVKGLQAGDQVVTHGNIKVKPGSPVKILAVDDGSVDISTIIKGKTIKGK